MQVVDVEVPNQLEARVVLEAPMYEDFNGADCRKTAQKAAIEKIGPANLDKEEAIFGVNDKGDMVVPGDGQAATKFRRKYKFRAQI